MKTRVCAWVDEHTYKAIKQEQEKEDYIGEWSVVEAALFEYLRKRGYDVEQRLI